MGVSSSAEVSPASHVFILWVWCDKLNCRYSQPSRSVEICRVDGRQQLQYLYSSPENLWVATCFIQQGRYLCVNGPLPWIWTKWPSPGTLLNTLHPQSCCGDLQGFRTRSSKMKYYAKLNKKSETAQTARKSSIYIDYTFDSWVQWCRKPSMGRAPKGRIFWNRTFKPQGRLLICVLQPFLEKHGDGLWFWPSFSCRVVSSPVQVVLILHQKIGI
jgi:hypothetical protein